jgi:hypothetical protein
LFSGPVALFGGDNKKFWEEHDAYFINTHPEKWLLFNEVSPIIMI